jgi:D-glycero-D-manno-heptose 1,7-bisphosphate phosphatase
MKQPAVFIDRDGTVNEQLGYINHESRFVIFPCVAEAVKLLNDNGFLAILVTNQSGIGRGYYPEDLVLELHDRLRDHLAEIGARLDGIYYCPHHPHAELEAFREECRCRKPRTGLIDQALKDFDIDMPRSYVVGDRFVDIDFAGRAGLKGVLVKTGYGRGEIEYKSEDNPRPEYMAEDLLEAVKWILEQEGTFGEKSP